MKSLIIKCFKVKYNYCLVFHYWKKIVCTVFILLIVFLFSTESLYGQETGLYVDQRSQYVVHRWDNTNGLPQSTVLSIASDNLGFLWLATENGLVRFDGKKFKNYDTSVINELESTNFIDIEISKYGGIWASSQEDIIRIKDNYEVLISTGNFTGNLISSIAEDSEGKLWVGTNLGDLLTFDGETLSRIQEWDSEKKGSVLNIDAADSVIYVGTSKGLYKFDEVSHTISEIELFRDIQIRSLFVMSNNEVWIGTDTKGLFHLTESDTVQYDQAHGFHENTINDVFVSGENEVWAATASSGLYKLTGSNFESFSARNEVGDNVRSIYVSEEGIVWLGTSGSGLIQLKPAGIYRLPDDHILSNSIILAIYQHFDNSIWVGTAGNGIYKLDGNDLSHYTINDGLSNEVILSIYGTDEYIYVGSANGLNRFNLSTQRFDKIYTKEDGMASNLVQVIYHKKNGELLIATRQGGIYKMVNDELKKIAIPEKLSNTTFYSIFEASDGSLWLGTEGMGVIKMNDEGEVQQFTTDEGLQSNIVFNVYEDADSSIWLATYKGISVITEDTLISYGKRNKLNNEERYTIVPDKAGYVWLSSNSGLHRIATSEMMAAKRDVNHQFKYRVYTREHGMPNSEANGGIFPANWIVANDDIWFPTIEGVAIVKPDQLTEDEDPVKVVFENLKFGGEHISGNGNIKVPAGVRHIEAEYTSIDFISPELINYSYRIVEIDEQWTNVGNETNLYLAIQSPGDYTLEVRAEKNGFFSEIVSQNFSVQPFFYQTLLFRILIAVLVFGLGYLVNQAWSKSKRSRELEVMVSKRTSNLHKALEEKNVLLQEVHHRVKNNLAVVSAMLQLQIFEENDPKVLKYLMSSTSRIKTIANIHEHLYKSKSFSNIDFKNNLTDLIIEIENFYNPKKDIDVELNMDEVQLNVNQAVPCSLILNEVIVNCFKHAFEGKKNGKITIDMSVDLNEVKIKISDNGVGLPSDFEEKNQSSGISIVKVLIEQLSAKSNFVSTQNGTEFLLKFEKMKLKGSTSSIID